MHGYNANDRRQEKNERVNQRVLAAIDFGKKSEETKVSSIVINFTLLIMLIILGLFISPPFAPLLVQNTQKMEGDAHASIKVKITNLAKKQKQNSCSVASLCPGATSCEIKS